MPEPMFHPQLVDYLDSLVPPRDAVLAEMEDYAREIKFPIIGTAAGYFNYILARISGATQIFEMGSGFGYSTAWFARAVLENGGGNVHHVVWDDELSNKARGYMSRLGYSDVVKFHSAEAIRTLAETEGMFDIIFNDIDKHAYPASIAGIKQKLKPGGILIIDNMLWHGAIFDPTDATDNTRGVNEVTRMLTTDPDFKSTLVPIRDGMIMAWYNPV